jgi:hypothetical protein
MKNFKTTLPLSLLLLLGPLQGISHSQQQRVFDWQQANDETARLDPANYHSGRTYGPSPDGGKIHVEIKSQSPVTVFLADAGAWNQALQHPESLSNVPQICTQEHVVELTYVCALPQISTTLVIRDERYNPDADTNTAVFAGLGAVLNGNSKIDNAIGAGVAAVLGRQESATRKFISPNDVHIQYYRWICVENCIQPEFQWISQFKEKYGLTSFPKVYGGFAPDHDQALVSIKIISPAPMIVAILPSQVADRLYAKPDTLETALERNSCQQRGVQKLTFQCSFNIADGPQSLVVVPEPTSNVPHKKAEVEMQAVKCIANCQLIEVSGKSDAMAGAKKNE